MAIINGDDGANTLFGTSEDDTINGLGGDDRLYYGGGIDTVNGGSGDDTIIYDSSRAIIDGGDGFDTLSFEEVPYAGSTASSAFDIDLTGYAVTGVFRMGDHDVVGVESLLHFELGTVGNDRVDFDAAAVAGVTFNGALGADTLLGTAGDDTLGGGDGNDYLEGRDGNDRLSGGLGVSQSDQLFGGDGDDVLNGFRGADQLLGEDGDDVLLGDAGGDALDGGIGTDTVSYIGSQAVHVRLQGYGARSDEQYAFGGEAEGDTLAGFENAIGSNFSDSLIGSNGANLLVGAAGNDTITGRNGDDTIAGGAGGDALDGGLGTDTVSYASSSQAVHVRLQGYGARSDEQYAFGGDAEGDTLAGFENAHGSANDDTLIGSNGSNVLDGGDGYDVLTGRGGADAFRFTVEPSAANYDYIKDYSAADDTIELDDAAFAGLVPGALSAGAFVIGAAAGDADDRIIYNSSTGELLFDADGSGSGAAVTFATLAGAPAMTASEFFVI